MTHCRIWIASIPHRPREALMAAKFQIYKDGRGEYRFRLKASNGEIVATGESYKSKSGVKDGIEAVKRAAASATVDDTTD